MAEIAPLRRKNLASLQQPTETQAEFIARLRAKVGNSYTYWRDVLRVDEKSFGEKKAREIEEKLELPPLWLDQEHGKRLKPAPRSPGEPRPPAGDFTDRREFNESDWSLLQDIKITLGEEEIRSIKRRAQNLRDQYEQSVGGKVKKQEAK